MEAILKMGDIVIRPAQKLDCGQIRALIQVSYYYFFSLMEGTVPTEVLPSRNRREKGRRKPEVPRMPQAGTEHGTWCLQGRRYTFQAD
jgi:hypothetical protein